jgi:hypothetical protein
MARPPRRPAREPATEPIESLPPGDHPELRADLVVLFTRWRPVSVTIALALAATSLVRPVGGLGLFFPAMFLLAAWAQYRFRTELQADAVSTDTGFRRRRVAWTQVGDIVVVRAAFGVRRVVLVTAEGVVALPVPVLHRFSSSERFARQAGLIHSWWQLHRAGGPRAPQ